MSPPDDDEKTPPDEEKTPPAGLSATLAEPPASLPVSFLPTPVAVDRPWPLDQKRERGTDPHIKLDVAYTEAKVAKVEREKKTVEETKKKKRKPWYITAAAVAGTFTASLLGGSFFHSRGAHQTAEKTNAAVVLSNDALQQKAADEQRARERLEDEVKSSRRELDRLQADMDLLLDHARVPKSKRPKEDEDP